MFLREREGTKLADLRDIVNDNSESTVVSPGQVEIDLTGSDPHFRVGEVSLPVTSRGKDVLGTLVKVPTAFLDRLLPDEQEFILRRTLSRYGGTMAIAYDQEGITGAYEPKSLPINPGLIVNSLAKVLGEDADVITWRNEPSEFAVDVVTGRDEGKGVGGDPNAFLESPLSPGGEEDPRRMEGDITKGGVTLLYPRGRQNLAPQVQPFSYRLWCTNGCDHRHTGLRIDMRNANTVDAVLAEIERAAQIAMDRIDADIAALYDLRSKRVANPERALRAMATEHGLSDRITMSLINRIPAELQDDEAITEFDLVNLITNEANNPTYVNRPGAVRQLRAAAGAITTQHAARCTHCNHALARA